MAMAMQCTELCSIVTVSVKYDCHDCDVVHSSPVSPSVPQCHGSSINFVMCLSRYTNWHRIDNHWIQNRACPLPTQAYFI